MIWSPFLFLIRREIIVVARLWEIVWSRNQGYSVYRETVQVKSFIAFWIREDRKSEYVESLISIYLYICKEYSISLLIYSSEKRGKLLVISNEEIILICLYSRLT